MEDDYIAASRPTSKDVDPQKATHSKADRGHERDDSHTMDKRTHGQSRRALLSSLVNALNVFNGEGYPDPVSLPSDPQTTHA